MPTHLKYQIVVSGSDVAGTYIFIYNPAFDQWESPDGPTMSLNTDFEDDGGTGSAWGVSFGDDNGLNDEFFSRDGTSADSPPTTGWFEDQNGDITGGSIVVSVVDPTLSITSGDNGVVWFTGTSLSLSLTNAPPSTQYEIGVSIDGGASYQFADDWGTLTTDGSGNGSMTLEPNGFGSTIDNSSDIADMRIIAAPAFATDNNHSNAIGPRFWCVTSNVYDATIYPSRLAHDGSIPLTLNVYFDFVNLLPDNSSEDIAVTVNGSFGHTFVDAVASDFPITLGPTDFNALFTSGSGGVSVGDHFTIQVRDNENPNDGALSRSILAIETIYSSSSSSKSSASSNSSSSSSSKSSLSSATSLSSASSNSGSSSSDSSASSRSSESSSHSSISSVSSESSSSDSSLSSSSSSSSGPKHWRAGTKRVYVPGARSQATYLPGAQAHGVSL